MPADSQIRHWVDNTTLVDTHEHLIEESMRVAGVPDGRLFPCDDWAYLFWHYLGDDLHGAGMPPDDAKRFFAPETPTDAKYRLVAPYWERAKHTGYGQAVRHTLRGLYSEQDLTAKSVNRIAEKYRAMVRPGFYRDILRDKSNLGCCHVNSLQKIFMETAQPELLKQDIGFPALSNSVDLQGVENDCGKTAATLEEWLGIIDWYFATYGPRAVAAKNQGAYGRRLDYEDVPIERAAPIFARHVKGESLAPDEWIALQDYLFRYCVTKAAEQGLPVKLHTGYYAGHDNMPLTRVRQNAGDLCGLLHDFPDAKFVLMHIGYPYQDEYIALAKHYANAYIDMCWTWIINPLASVRFLKEFLMAAPANKLFVFGGDYITVETVYGHSRVARLGIAQALSELVEEQWIAREECPALIERLMRGNARETFPAR